MILFVVSISLQSNTTAVEDDDHVYGYISQTNSDGFTVTAGSNNSFYTNGSSDTYVAWCWDAGDATVANTDGSIASQVRANPAAGFSVVSYTGDGVNDASVGHSLNAAPKLLIIKDRSASSDWDVTYTFGDGSYDFMKLNATDGKVDITGRSAPASSVFYASGNNSNVNGRDYIAYCWSEVPGVSSFGSYTGTSGAGNKQTLGFKPAYVLIKCTSTAAQEWVIFDTARSTSNPTDKYLYANSSAAEATFSNRKIEVLDDGFQFYGDDSAVNNSGDTYIYMAFADNNQPAPDTVLDTPMNNYAVLVKPNSSLPDTSPIINGNLVTNGAPGGGAISNIPIDKSKKYYFEVTTADAVNCGIGVTDGNAVNSNPGAGAPVGTYGMFSYNAGVYQFYNNGTRENIGVVAAASDVIGLAVDFGTRAMEFFVNGTSVGTYALGGNGTEPYHLYCMSGANAAPFKMPPTLVSNPLSILLRATKHIKLGHRVTATLRTASVEADELKDTLGLTLRHTLPEQTTVKVA